MLICDGYTLPPNPGPRYKLSGVSFCFFGSTHTWKLHHFHLTGNFLVKKDDLEPNILDPGLAFQE